MRKIVLLLGIGLLAVLSMFATPAGAQASTGTVTVIHGIPGLTVDVYVNGKLTLEDFAPDTVTAPLELPAGTYQIAIRPANAAADSTPVLAGSATLPAGANASIVAHLDASGQPKLTVFVNDTSSLAAGNARLVVRHTAAAPAVDVLANGKPAFTNLTNPNQATADLPAGTISASVAAAGTTTPVIGPVDLTLPDATVDRRVRGRLTRRQDAARARPDHPREHDTGTDDCTRSGDGWAAPPDRQPDWFAPGDRPREPRRRRVPDPSVRHPIARARPSSVRPRACFGSGTGATVGSAPPRRRGPSTSSTHRLRVRGGPRSSRRSRTLPHDVAKRLCARM